SGDAGNSVWLAPTGTTNFVADATMTTAGGEATSISAPSTGGVYYLYVIDAAGNVSLPSMYGVTVDNTPPTVVLTDDHPDAIVRNGDSVIITATFTEANQMDEVSGAPTIQIGGLINPVMTKQSNLVWTYTWNVPTGNDGVQAVVITSTDVAGNANTAATGKTSYTIDNIGPTVVLSDDQPDNVVMFGDTVLITATFSEADQINSSTPPTISIVDDISNQAMTEVSNLVWTYSWAVPSALYGDKAVSIVAYDRAGNTNSPATGRTSYSIPSKTITAFNFTNPAAIGVINEGGKTISLTVPSGTNVTSLVPTITHTGTSISPDTGIANDFTNSVIYTVTAADLSTQAYTVTVIAQSYNMSITSFAGAPLSLDGTGAAAAFYNPKGISVDSSGVLFVSDSSDHTIKQISAAGVVTNFAGTSESFGSNDGTGASARFKFPLGSDVDSLGNLYVADSENNTIRKITSGGVVTTFAGIAGSSGTTDGTGSAARFYVPMDVAVDSLDNVYIADTYNHTIRKITSGGVVTTIAGTAGVSGSLDANGISASFNQPRGIAIDSSGNLFVADYNNHTIRKIDAVGEVTTFAGTAGSPGSTDGTGTAAKFSYPSGVEVDTSGNVYVAELQGHRIRKITSAGVVTTFAGSGSIGFADGIGISATFCFPSAVAVDNSGNLYITDSHNFTTRKITTAAVVSTFAGTAPGTDGTGIYARFDYPSGVVVDSSGNVFVADKDCHTIRKITSAGVVSTFAGMALQSGSTDGTGSSARFFQPNGIAIDSSENLYVADMANNTIRKITSGGGVSTLAGSPGSSGSNDGTGSAARFYLPCGIAVDSMGNIYVADMNNHTIRKVTPIGEVTTLAGTAGISGITDGTGSAARFNRPASVGVDSAGNVYVADMENHTIRKITPGGVVTTLAGTAGAMGSNDGTGSVARFKQPQGLAVDSAGNIFVCDTDNATIRQVTPAGIVSTICGVAGSRGIVDGTGSSARFYGPHGIAVDNSLNVYVTDQNPVRKGALSPY
ncbi:MAG: hypothetical protein PHD82_09970, partial [Candidatus Riflebacteria bacterium]|nr:hypothetical protein [Candidatus Riflebacteria bacterium]